MRFLTAYIVSLVLLFSWRLTQEPTTQSSATPTHPLVLPANPPATTGGPGQVVNTRSNVYHCTGDRYYSKTKAGRDMSGHRPKAADFVRIMEKHVCLRQLAQRLLDNRAVSADN